MSYALEGGGAQLCNCIGPQDGKPLCPCRMRGVKVKDGRYVETIDHGPVPSITDEEAKERLIDKLRYSGHLSLGKEA